MRFLLKNVIWGWRHLAIGLGFSFTVSGLTISLVSHFYFADVYSWLLSLHPLKVRKIILIAFETQTIIGLVLLILGAIPSISIGINKRKTGYEPQNSNEHNYVNKGDGDNPRGSG